ncbi:TonB-dependent receptor [Bacteroides intestinalis]|jgi:outer membrane receptor protein involved in Fe transport|uniref:TonB-dependent receptor n=1 Tax=Bacteroides intestinalis TaxID=329854 RepID=A0A414LKT0_9BACE|nr:TonB-dependent receptor [Bacteroides intestinalis]RHE95245.1 TonB-dependent receptor [Bacteroides intestinalis]
MKKHLIHFLLVAVLSVFSAAAFAQTTVRGQLVDSETGEPLVGAAVMIEGTSQGTVTDIDGYFKQSVAQGGTLLFKYVGFKDLKKKITQKGASVDLGTIKMEPDAVMLADVTITSSIAVARKTPVAVSTIDPVFIEEKLGTQEFPEILKSTPGIYATKDGGGFGDSKINIRGFKSENSAMMVNGVPMNGMENNKVYWSNWSGLSDVTRSIQVQRGLGAAKVASPAVGGSINIITKTTEAKKGGSVSYAMGNDGYNKILFNLSSGLSKDGWAFSLLGAKTWGDGYIQGTEFEGYTWFVSIAKRFNDNHQLSLTAFGAPQWHNQRSNQNGLSIKEWQRVKQYMGEDSPYKYNSTFGYRHGQSYNSSRNSYHKPQISLNHLWQIDQKSSLSTALYVSIGRGDGYRGTGDSTYANSWYGSTNGLVNTQFRRPDGTFDYDAVETMNAESTNGSKMVMSKMMNNHLWYGLLSTYTTKFGENFDFYGGIDFRYYKGLHQDILTDLFGGTYFIDSYNRKNVTAENNPAVGGNSAYINQKLNVGDVLRRDYDGFVMYEGVFAQLEYNQDKLSAFISGGASNTGYWRYDRMYYSKDKAKSSTKNYLGGNIKGGANYNLTENHNVFVNAGYINRAPMFDTSFINSQTSHDRNPDAKNEKIMSFELGYGYRSRFFTANLNGYYTRWMDKALYDSGTTADGLRWAMNMTGANADHWGVEFDFVAKPLNWLDITGMFSWGDWRWGGIASGYLFDSQGQMLQNTRGDVVTDMANAEQYQYKIDMDNVSVGGSAQTTAALGLGVRPVKGLRLGVDWNFFSRNFADYDINANVATQNEPYVIGSPWKIPSYSTFDLSAGYTFDFGKIRATLSGNVNNVLDQEYIADARDGSTHDWESATRVLYGFGRTYSVRLKFNF